MALLVRLHPLLGRVSGWLFAALLLTQVYGCRSSERDEAKVMLQALELLQAAPPASRAELLDALEEQPASGALAETARRRCTGAYRALTAAKAAAAALPDGGLPNAIDRDARELLDTLRRADEQLKEATRLLPACREAVNALRSFAK